MKRKIKSKSRKNQLTPTGRKKKIIEPCLIKARNLRSSLNKRISPELKYTTPTIDVLYKWLKRDKYICYYSLEELTLDNLTIDHKIPLFRGGTNDLSNLCICSRKMNNIKGQLTEKEFKSLLKLVSKWEDGGASLFKRIRQGFFG